jgi:hypothetical protein
MSMFPLTLFYFNFAPLPPLQDEFLAVLSSSGLRVHPMSKDGNCLFRSFSHQIFGDASRHEEVRANCYIYMVQHFVSKLQLGYILRLW